MDKPPSVEDEAIVSTLEELGDSKVCSPEDHAIIVRASRFSILMHRETKWNQEQIMKELGDIKGMISQRDGKASRPNGDDTNGRKRRFGDYFKFGTLETCGRPALILTLAAIFFFALYVHGLIMDSRMEGRIEGKMTGIGSRIMQEAKTVAAALAKKGDEK